MELSFNSDGIVMTRDQIIEKRKKRGECLTCPAFPTKCFEIKRSLLNPIMCSKVPRTVDGTVYKGWCLLCHPTKDPNRKEKERTKRVKGSATKAHKRAATHDGNFTNVPAKPISLPSFGSGRRTSGSSTSSSKKPSSLGGLMNSFSKQKESRKNAHSKSENLSNRRNKLIKELSEQRSMPLIVSNVASDEDDDSDDASEHKSMVDTVASQETNTDIDDLPTVVADFGMEIQYHPSQSTVSAGSGRSIGSIVSNGNDQEGGEFKSSTLHKDDIEKFEALSSFVSVLEGDGSSENGAVIIDTVSNFLIDELDASGESQRLPSIDLAAFCITKLWEAARASEENKDSIMYSNGLDAIIQGMFVYAREDAGIQERGCGALWSLAVHPQNRSPIALAGGCHRVVDAMSNHISSERVQIMGLGAIKAFSGDRDGRASLESRGTLKVIVRAMKSNMKNYTIQLEGCSIISNLAIDSNTNQISMATNEEINAIVAAMKTHSARPELQKKALSALKNYSFSESNIETISKCSDAKRMIIWASKQYHEDCGEDAKIVLDQLNQFQQQKNDRSSSSLPNLHDNGPKVDEGENEAYEQLLVSLRLGSDDEIINNIINIMFERPLSDKIQDSGLQNIWYLLLKNDENKELVAGSSRALDVIMTSMNERSTPNDKKHINIQEHGCNIISNLASAGATNRLRLIHHQNNLCIEALNNAIENFIAVESVQVAALAACRVLLVEEDFLSLAKGTDGLRLMALSMRVHQTSSQIQREGKSIMMKLHSRLSSRRLLDKNEDPDVEEIGALLESLSISR